MCHYEYKNNQYHLIDDRTGEILYASDEIAIAFSYDKETKEGILYKHGSTELVSKWVQKTRKKFQNAGLHDIANEIIMIFGKINIYELNKCLNISGYIGKFYEKNLDKRI